MTKKSIKLKNNKFWDSSSIVHNKQNLKDILVQKINLQLESNVSIDTYYTSSIYKYLDSIVCMNIRLQKKVNTIGYTKLGTLPVGARPPHLSLFQYTNEGGGISFIYINSNGDIMANVQNTNYSTFSIMISFNTK